MNYQSILQQLYPEGSIGPGEGVYKGQCAVFVQNLMSIPKVGDTIESKIAAVKKYGYTAQQVQGGYSAGDAIVLDVGTKAGHVLFLNQFNPITKIGVASEANWFRDGKVHHTRQINLMDKSVIGCLRGKLLFDVPPQTFNQKVLVLCYNIPDITKIQEGINSYITKVQQKTTDFNISVDYAVTKGPFTVIQQGTTIYIQPADVANEGLKVQQQTGKQYDVVCLVYDNSQMTPHPNHPTESPLYLHGFNVIEIPLDWISDGTQIFPNSVETFFSHELSHANYFLINIKGGFTIRDKTHDAQILGYPSPIDYFLQYLMELKPFWSYLVT